MIRNVLKRFHQRFDPTLLKPLKTSSPASLFHTATKTLAQAPKLNFVSNDLVEESEWKWRVKEEKNECSLVDNKEECVVQKISHPWPEWVNLMKYLLKKGYFDGAEGNPFENGDLGAKECNVLRTACLNFGRDRFELLRFLSRNDIGVTVALGCPSLDRKVVNSGKRLRAHVGIDEGNVCSSCNLRGDCDRAFVKAREDEGGRTVDVMRIILTYGLDPIIGSVQNKPCINKKVKESVISLLREIVEQSTNEEDSNRPDTTKVLIGQVIHNPRDKGKVDVLMKPGDWLCPKCNFNNFARNIKCLRCDSFFEERIKQLQEDNNHLPLKKGDWICIKCNFLNFAKNTRCFLCKEKPPKRHLNPGEWECDSCNYINFRRNMVCLKCDHRRPKVLNASNSSDQPQHEDKDYPKNSRMTFVRRLGDSSDKSSMFSGRKNRNKDSPMWRFGEDRVEDRNYLNTSNGHSQSIDFSIAGGKAKLPEPRKREAAAKNELLNRWESESDDELGSSDINSTDDEDMSEWFGNGKNER
ncbi:putative Zinc finger, RanBP2-type [Lupinus albus]|uniref:Putative Zinc finger, RanBP2-type n=1 Tax=Lupinus albus TaxID=3870 RepID=A0A6A4PVI0_LUPAL|nr:putative Zinc finger, RanBP2-type [Lupinus albus]